MNAYINLLRFYLHHNNIVVGLSYNNQRDCLREMEMIKGIKMYFQL